MIRTRMITAGYQLRFQRLLLALRDAVQITQKMTVCSGSLLRHRFFGDNYVQQSGGRSFYSKTALNSIHTFCSFSVVKPKKTGITTLFLFSCVNFDFINWERTPNTLWLLLHNSVYIFPSQHPPTMYWGKIVKSQNPSDKEMGDSQGINKGQTCCYILKQQKDSKGKFLKLGNIGTRLWMGHFTTLRHSALLMVHTCGLHRIPQQTSVLEECLSAGNEARCKQSLRPNAVLYERAGKSWAAVLVSLCTVMGQPALLFTLRSSMLKGRHKGDISFAGGKKDPSDKTVIDTALREAHEELGIHIAEDQVWGVLKPLHDMSGMTIAPVIANLGQLETLSFQPNPTRGKFASPHWFPGFGSSHGVYTSAPKHLFLEDEVYYLLLAFLPLACSLGVFIFCKAALKQWKRFLHSHFTIYVNPKTEATHTFAPVIITAIHSLCFTVRSIESGVLRQWPWIMHSG